MIFYVLVFASAVIFSVGLILIQPYFFRFALATTSLLNAILNDVLDEDAKQKLLVRRLVAMLKALALYFLLPLSIIIVFTFLPYLLIEDALGFTVNTDTSSVYFYLVTLVGGVIPFLFVRKTDNEDYSEWSKLLHRMILDNSFISKQLFQIEKKLFLRPTNSEKSYVIVTGLARAGTTALTKQLFETENFCSLSYANMPFLLAPNLWGKFYKPKPTTTRERTHGDGIQFGFQTIEALEEYFFKVNTNDAFMGRSELLQHEVSQEVYFDYRSYQQLVCKGDSEKVYLAKNNNLMLRYASLRRFDEDFKAIVVVRNPIEHAVSLHKQHQRFSQLHSNDPFSLEYMNWLGHHEFGNNHKPFNLMTNLRSGFNPNEINYWLACWVEYYQFVEQYQADKNLIFVSHQALCNNPKSVLESIRTRLNLNFTVQEKSPFNQPSFSEPKSIDEKLKQQAFELFERLNQFASM